MNSDFRLKRSDTKVATLETTSRIDLNARGDMLPGNLLEERGFNTQLNAPSPVGVERPTAARERGTGFTKAPSQYGTSKSRDFLGNPRWRPYGDSNPGYCRERAVS